MTPNPIAHLLYLTEPVTGRPTLNIQLRPGETWPSGSFIRLELTQRQLASILVDGTAMALRQASPSVGADI